MKAATYCAGAVSYTLTIRQPSGSTDFSDSISGNTAVACKESVVLTINTEGAIEPTYQWYKNGTPVRGATAATLTVTTAGTYNATFIATNANLWNGKQEVRQLTITINP